jgi:non-lysosomal glucosylceramidase
MNGFKFNRKNTIYKILSLFIILIFMISTIVPPSFAQSLPNTLILPAPGTLMHSTTAFTPAIVQGINIDPNDPLRFDFIVDKGDSGLEGEEFRQEGEKLIKYFLASLTIPEDQMWVNLSPYEKDRIVPDIFGQTEMGRDLLAQDYLLKQLTSSLMHPEEALGKKFWQRVYKRAQEQFGTTEIPINTFNKIWIVPGTATIYEHAKGAFIVDSHLKVMLEEDYLALEENRNSTKHGLGDIQKEDLDVITGVSSQVVQEVLIPEIEREVNEGKHFANLRQIYHSMLLAKWYKQSLQQTLLGQVYADQGKIKGVETSDKDVNQKIYEQYVQAFKQGVFDFIKEDYDERTQQIIPRKYFSGGVDWSEQKLDIQRGESVRKKTRNAKLKDGAMLSWRAKGLGIAAAALTGLLGLVSPATPQEIPSVSQLLQSPQALVIPADREFPQHLPRTPGEDLKEMFGNAGITGGMGTGSFSRDVLGRTRNVTFSANPVLEHLPQAQTSIFVKMADGSTYAVPLGVKSDEDPRLATWNWQGAEEVAAGAVYSQAFPFSSWIYPTDEQLPVEVTMVQFSPFIPGNLDATTEPVSITRLDLHNPTKQPLDVSVMFSQPNLTGYELKRDPNNPEAYVFAKHGANQRHAVVETEGLVGVVMDADEEVDPRFKGQMVLVTRKLAGISVSYTTAIDVSEGDDVWSSFSKTGQLPNDTTPNSSGAEQAGALAVKVELQPGQNLSIPFVYAWDFPIDSRNGVQFKRHHTARYGAEGDDALKIASHALENMDKWESQIKTWQQRILDNPLLSDVLKKMLINETYFFVSSGIVITEDGQVYIPESLVYRILNTLDVMADGGAMLKELFPQLYKAFVAIQAEYVFVTSNEPTAFFNIFPAEYGFNDPDEIEKAREFFRLLPGSESIQYLSGSELEQAYNAGEGFRPTVRYLAPLWPVQGAKHHLDDFLLGPISRNPDQDGQAGVNDTTRDGNLRWQHHVGWSDLQAKHVLMVFDAAKTSQGALDAKFLKQVVGKNGETIWDSVKTALNRLKDFDTDADGLPNHRGIPDQTFDTWRMTGAGIMTADLTIAALEMGKIMAEAVGDTEVITGYQEWQQKALSSVSQKLEREGQTYFDVYEGKNDVMAYAFPGSLFLMLNGLEPLIPRAKLRSHMEAVFQNNFIPGLGVLNGVKIGGKVAREKDEIGDSEKMMGFQEEEIWIGVQRNVAALMILLGMRNEAFAILQTDYERTWANGFFNMIPEAYDSTGGYRSEIYMRAGAIYNVQRALEIIHQARIHGFTDYLENATQGMNDGKTPADIQTIAMLRMAGLNPNVQGTDTPEASLKLRQKVTPSEEPDESTRETFLFPVVPGMENPVVVSGDNAWYGIISPLQQAYLKHGEKIPVDSPEFNMALDMADNLINLQAENGGIYLAPKETTDTTGIPNRDISNAHAARVAIALNALLRASALNGYGDTEKYAQAYNRIAEYFRLRGFNPTTNLFNAGGKYGDYVDGQFVRNSDVFNITPNFATDVQWNAILAFGPDVIDEWFGPRAAYKIWQETKRRAGTVDGKGNLLGFGLVEGNDHIHALATFDAIAVGQALASYYGGEVATAIGRDTESIILHGINDLVVSLPDGTMAIREAKIYDPAINGIKTVWWAKPEDGLKETPSIQATALGMMGIFSATGDQAMLSDMKRVWLALGLCLAGACTMISKTTPGNYIPFDRLERDISGLSKQELRETTREAFMRVHTYADPLNFLNRVKQERLDIFLSVALEIAQSPEGIPNSYAYGEAVGVLAAYGSTEEQLRIVREALLDFDATEKVSFRRSHARKRALEGISVNSSFQLMNLSGLELSPDFKKGNELWMDSYSARFNPSRNVTEVMIRKAEFKGVSHSYSGDETYMAFVLPGNWEKASLREIFMQEITRIVRPTGTIQSGEHHEGAMTGAYTSQVPGGIDFNSDIVEMQLEKEGRGVQIPAALLIPRELYKIEGFVPTIINVVPIQNYQLPMILGLGNTNLQRLSYSAGH